jgi:hypothetical protein
MMDIRESGQKVKRNWFAIFDFAQASYARHDQILHSSVEYRLLYFQTLLINSYSAIEFTTKILPDFIE